MSSIRTTTDEEEPIVTCSELLEQIEDEEEELDRERALYGNCDVDTCTYSQGYVRRQPLFACMTCNNNDQLTGICAACAYHCHVNHEINELYTKRFFRCDCGNFKLSHQPCKLYPTKDPENILNKYNDNFRGIYCTCKCSYPNKEKKINDDEMIQCIICEDWFHSQHLGVPLPMEENEINQMDIICQACVTKYSFLVNYDESRGVILQPSIDNNVAVASNNSSCLLLSNNNNNTEIHTIFLREGWRKRLCRCVQCSKLYDELNLTSIFDDDDAIQEYEKQALAKSENLDADKIIADSLENLGYVRKLEVLHGINEFKKSLGDFLREKANSDDVLTAEDVTTFFTNLKEKHKEQQRTTFIPPDNCKF
ncbi:unnamed protein product [Rotaria sordida]|uniref:UBR-type domain-containing protein n=1 Tax=Rotaria sordida TaxID=392033 RepID=A0A818R1L7_9BILA|nr:unnamed protein product [Rotaria sordida]CAF0831587.1 unnamed protein product [Rotaria sordida]CAF3626842.1 unnamed protein product [Rotaria sordida]CAF3650432.1 unnamed protein product [Rotaria sordida]